MTPRQVIQKKIDALLAQLRLCEELLEELDADSSDESSEESAEDESEGDEKDRAPTPSANGHARGRAAAPKAERVRPEGVTPSTAARRRAVLDLLAAAPRTMSQISAALKVPAGTMTRLMHHEWFSRGTGYAAPWSLTESGRRALESPGD